jgi:hypothetical protein
MNKRKKKVNKILIQKIKKIKKENKKNKIMEGLIYLKMEETQYF